MSSKAKAVVEREWIDHNFNLLKDFISKKKNSPCILAADFSVSSTGYAVIDLDGKLLDSGEIKTTTQDGTLQQRLWKIFKGFEQIVAKHPCCIFSYEMISVFSNPTSAIKLSMVLAEMYNALSSISEEPPYIVSIATTSIKKAATGSGSSDKNLILKSVFRTWGEDFNSDDTADAYVAARVALDLLKVKDIYFAMRKQSEVPLDKFLIDFEKARLKGLKEELEKHNIEKHRFEVIVSLMKGGGQAKENNYDFYKESRKAILQQEPVSPSGDEGSED
jgi:Holliday junction resolvasome RuvABC endonuclease subunit